MNRNSTTFLKNYISNMKLDNNKIKSIMATVNITLLVFAYTVLINSFLEFRINKAFIFITSTMITYLIYKWDNNKKRAITYIIIVSICIGFIVGSFLLKINLGSEIKKWLLWIVNYNFTEEYYIKAYGRLSCILIEIVMGVVFYLLHGKNRVRIMTAIVLIGGGIFLSATQVFVPKVTVAITLYYIMWVITENCGYHRKKTMLEVDNHLAVTFLAPVCLLLAFIVLIFPSPVKPLSWKGVIRFAEKVQEQGSILMTKLEYFLDANGSIFSISEAGYTEEETELGGSVSTSNKTSIIVTTRNKSTAGTYLAGSISNIYTGRGWGKGKDNIELKEQNYYYDIYNLVIAFATAKDAGVDISNLIKTRELQIKYNNIRTRSIFTPIKTYWLNVYKGTKYAQTPQGSLILNKAKSSGMEYELKYYEMNLENPLFGEILMKDNSNIRPRQATIRTVLEEIFHYSDTDIKVIEESIYKELKLLEEDIYQNYTTLPKDLPNRVKSLAEELTKDVSSNYEKLKILEAYLNSFKYTTNIKKTPKGEDFVDYFLFQQKEGYCTYYASAMGVMARCLNIPTRYMEGFVLDYEENEGDYKFIVKSNKAHAWVEAYISGVGWIPFEPTPGFYNIRYTRWKEYGFNSQDESKTPLLLPQVPASYENFGYNGNEELASNSESGLRNRKYLVISIIVIIASINLCIILFGFSYLLARKRYHKNYMRAADNDRFIMDFKKILRFLQCEGYYLSKDDTLLVFIYKVGKNFNLKSLSFVDLGNLFMKVRYGEKELTKDELVSISNLKSEYEIHLREKIGFWKMFFHEFKFLHFYQ